MKLTRLPVLVMAAGLATTVVAQTSLTDAPEQRRRLIEQKIKLVEMLVNSPAAKSAAYGREAESATLVERGQKALDAARKALAENRYEDATKSLDEALKSASSASRKLSADGSGLSESAQRKTLSDLSEQVTTYRSAVADLTKDPKIGSDAKALLSRIDAISGEARQLGDAGRLGEANKKMAAAYKLAVEELSKLRAGHEVVMSLKFDTPADEFAYELKRFASNSTLVDLMISEGKADGDRRKLVDNLVGAGAKLKAQAETEAAAGQHKAAITLMEQAISQLNRALQTMGVPVF